MNRLNNTHGSISLISLLTVAAIVCVLGYFMFNQYFATQNMDNETKEFFADKGLDTTNQKAVLDSTKEMISDMEQIIQDREKTLMDAYNNKDYYDSGI